MLNFKERAKHTSKRYGLSATEATSFVACDKQLYPREYDRIRSIEDLDKYYDSLEKAGEEWEKNRK